MSIEKFAKNRKLFSPRAAASPHKRNRQLLVGRKDKGDVITGGTIVILVKVASFLRWG
jgi:hypothetical protein